MGEVIPIDSIVVRDRLIAPPEEAPAERVKPIVAPDPLVARDRDFKRLQKAWDAACPEARDHFMGVERVRTAFMEHLNQPESRAAA